MVEPIFKAISFGLAPILALGPLAAIVIITILESLLITLIYKWLTPKGRMVSLKKEMAEIRVKMKTVQKEKKEKEMKELMERSLKLSREQMSLTMKPMLVSMVPVFVILPWMGWESSFKVLFPLPFWMPILGPDVSWLGLFLILTLPTTIVLRKVLGVD